MACDAGACEALLAYFTCHVIFMDMEYYNKLDDTTDVKNDMLDLSFGMTDTYLRDGLATKKTNVYVFGVVHFEMLKAKRGSHSY
ncbi:2Fe-2S ferredoxin [Capsicum baccatum]|uniref:2Fe-2S ferredoxin n=1 Tax=Capsicum baccatum TaxID=33114 RepID=A0A2G2V9Y4_CAPBA|nr:2Fe-2S ferredoxin [Capsicum baccatum]